MGFLKQTFKTARQAQLWKDFLKADSDNHRQMAKSALLKSIGDDKGLSMKIGQLLANQNSDSDLVKTVYSNEAIQQSLEQMLPILVEELGCPVDDIFTFIDSKAEAASLGQVHKGRLLTGQDVAVKIQYPGIREEIENQIKLFGLTPNIGPAKKWGIPLNEYKETLSNLLENEVHYNIELETGEIIYNIFSSHPYISTPNFYPELSSDWVLVQDWMDGNNLLNIKELERKHRLQLADSLVEFFVVLFAKHNLVQTDFHRGNFKWEINNDQLILKAFDFGAVKHIPSHLSRAVLNFIYHGSQATSADPISLLESVGFDVSKLRHIAPQCAEIVRILCEPFADKYRFEFKHWKAFDRIKLALGEDNWWFRSSGSPEFFLLMKAFQGLQSILLDLDVGVSFLDTVERTATDQWTQSKSSTIPDSKIEAPKINSLANRLHVLLLENNVEKVNMSLAITCIYDLENILDQEVNQKIQSQGIEVKKVVYDFLKSGGQPGVIFQSEYDSKILKVWAE